MGKRHSVAVAGLARFMHVFDESAPPSSSTISEDATMTMHRKGSLETENALAGPSHPKRATSGGRTSRPPKKKRKTGLLGPGHERHDATGLVSRYTDATQVPGHLQKCASEQPMLVWLLIMILRRFCPTKTVLLAL
jgi:trimethylguanosine synthase